MSEYFQGVTFANQNVTPVDDAILRRRLLSDGILTGCELTYAGYTLTMAAGYLIACGRQIRRPTAENWAISDATSGYARVLMTVDLTRTSTEEVFDQVNTSIEYATSSDGFPALIQDDINATGSKYQLVLAVVSLGIGGITCIVRKLSASKTWGSSHNLLDNSDFLNPVNQRGKTSTIGSHLIDRWSPGLSSVSLSIDENGFTVSGGDATYNCPVIQQIERNFIGKVMTFAVCDSDGTIIVASGLVKADGPSVHTYTDWGSIYFHQRSEKLFWAAMSITYGKTKTFRWAALYEGMYTEETLPEYQPKGYGLELQECLRYLFVVDGEVNYSHIKGYASSTTQIDLHNATFPTIMRAKPSITSLTIRDTASGVVSNPTVSGLACTKNGVASIIVGGTTLTAGRTYNVKYIANAEL